MVRKRILLNSIDETVTRPVLVTVANDIKSRIGISADAYTTFDEKDAFNRLVTSTGDFKEETTKLQEGVIITYDVDPIDDQDISLLRDRNDQYPLYVDKEINSKIQTLKVNKTFKITFKYFANSRSKVNTLVNRINIMFSGPKSHISHEIEYYYMLPKFVFNLLYNINLAKNDATGEENTLEQYLYDHFDNRLKVLNTADGDFNKVSLSVREAQIGVLGYSDSDNYTLKKQYDESKGVWYFEIDYVIEYEEPILMDLFYPIMIFNKTLPKEFLPEFKQPAPTKGYRSGSTVNLYDVINGGKDPYIIKKGFNYLTFPANDAVKLNNSIVGYSRLFSVVIQVDKDNPNQLLNIDDIPNFSFKENIKDFLLNTERGYIGVEHQSLFYINVFDKDKQVYGVTLNMDTYGNVTSDVDLDIKGEYRFCFYISNDFYMMSSDAQVRFKDYLLKEKDWLDDIFRVNDDYRYIYIVNYYMLLLDEEDYENYLKVRHMRNSGIRYTDITYQDDDGNTITERVYLENKLVVIDGLLKAGLDYHDEFNSLIDKLQYSDDFIVLTPTVPTKDQVIAKQQMITDNYKSANTIYPHETISDIYVDLFEVPDKRIQQQARKLSNYTDIVFSMSDFNQHINTLKYIATETYRM